MVFEKIRVMLADQFEVEEGEITVETNLITDLSADSIDVVELIMSIEDEFGIEIPESDVENIKTVGEAVKYVESLL